MKRAVPTRGKGEFADVWSPTHQRTVGHEEWMIDESVEQTFPASDPTTTSQPGSIVWQRYAATNAADRTLANEPPWLRLAIITAAVACAAVVVARRLRRR